VAVGDPMRPLMWLSKSHAKLAAALRDMGHEVSASRIPKLLTLSMPIDGANWGQPGLPPPSLRIRIQRTSRHGSRESCANDQFQGIDELVRPGNDIHWVGAIVKCTCLLNLGRPCEPCRPNARRGASCAPPIAEPRALFRETTTQAKRS
jgi:hypothetical protein